MNRPFQYFKAKTRNRVNYAFDAAHGVDVVRGRAEPVGSGKVEYQYHATEQSGRESFFWIIYDQDYSEKNKTHFYYIAEYSFPNIFALCTDLGIAGKTQALEYIAEAVAAGLAAEVHAKGAVVAVETAVVVNLGFHGSRGTVIDDRFQVLWAT
jgi:hypothetical protein